MMTYCYKKVKKEKRKNIKKEKRKRKYKKRKNIKKDNAAYAIVMITL
jgi:hypothetical protein